MPNDGSPAQSVLAELGFVLFERGEAGELRLLGKALGWLAKLWPALEEKGGPLPLSDASPFLENFLIDAEECWKKGGTARANSGPWVERDPDGTEMQLEASALTVDGQPILLLERLGEAFEAKKTVLQRARETVIAHQRLNSEIQKKEILLHCVADEMTAALANIITSLRLIELEDNGPRTKLLLGLANRATQEQQTLINRILGVFEEELQSVAGRSGLANMGTDADAVLRHALESAAPLYAEKDVRLEMPPANAGSAKVSADATHLERVATNLLEAALERTPAGGTVVVRAEEEADALLWQVEDNGSALKPDICDHLFLKWDPANGASAATALRLHFCRIVVENCGGEIGCEPLARGGNRCWIRLTKSDGTP